METLRESRGELHIMVLKEWRDEPGVFDVFKGLEPDNRPYEVLIEEMYKDKYGT